MLNHNQLKKGTQFLLNGDPYEVLEHAFIFKGRGGSVNQTKLKNLLTGNILAKTFHPGEGLEEIEIEKIEVKFIYTNREKYVFAEKKEPSKRFELNKEVIGNGALYLKENQIITGIKFKDKIINISLPVKVNLKVIEAPPSFKGDTAQGGTKVVTLETGAQINAPLFIKIGDMIEVNTEKGVYSQRV